MFLSDDTRSSSSASDRHHLDDSIEEDPTCRRCAAAFPAFSPRTRSQKQNGNCPFSFLKLSLSRFACPFMWFRVRGVAFNWREFFILPSSFCVGGTSLHSFSRVSFVAFTRFSSILRQFSSFFLLFFYMKKKYISLSREEKDQGVALFPQIPRAWGDF